MNRKSGVLTIEAAIVLPLVIIAFISILFFAKVYYIQDQVHSAITKTAHDLSVDVYVIDQLGVTDIQQDLYLEGADSLGGIQSAMRGVADSAGTLMVSGNNAVGFSHDLNGWFTSVSEIEWDGSHSLLEVGNTALDLIDQSEGIVSEVSTSITGMMDALKLLYEEGCNGMGDVAMMEVVDFANGLVSEKVSEAVFYKYLPKTQLEAWGVYSGTDVVDLSMSNMLLYDDTIEVVAAYEIEIPLGQAWFGSSIPVLQKVRARAWTGSYDSSDHKNQPESGEDEEAEEIFYISDLDPSASYHYYSCLRKTTVESTYAVEVEGKARRVCQYCESHLTLEGSDMAVYYTSSKAVIHYDPHCPKIWSPEITAVTVEEAEAANHGDPCSKYNCVDDPRKRTE